MVHHQTQHGVAKGRLGQEVDEVAEDDKTRTYRMVFTATPVHYTLQPGRA